MSQQRKLEYIAWEIAESIMARSRVPLQILKMHPCGGQYACLGVLPAEEPFRPESIASINLHGEHINTHEGLIESYPHLYEQDKESLLQTIASKCHYNLAPNPVRTHASVRFIRDLLLDDKFEACKITAAWYDASYGAHLDESAVRFPLYDLKHKSKVSSPHLPWWTISMNNTTLAMCNTVSDELVLFSGTRYNLEYSAPKAILALRRLIIMHTEFGDVVSAVSSLLDANREDWEPRYSRYADTISDNMVKIQAVQKTYSEWVPLKLYMNVPHARNIRKKVRFELRYMGQTVANLESKDTLRLTTTRRQQATNKKSFACSIQLENADWTGPESREFRDFFKDMDRKNPPSVKIAGNEEQRLQSLLISEFSKTGKNDKALSNIQPVKMAKIRFPMPTPISITDHRTIHYAGIYGVAIDLLARTGKSSKTTTLCIMELKDENLASEPPIEALKQAIAYAAFLRELLRSSNTDSGEIGRKWWNLFGFTSPIPEKLTLCAACVMPANGNIDTSFTDMELAIGSDTIRLHYLYFDEEDNRIKKIQTSL